MSDEFAYDVTDGIATLRLCRPDKGNVLSRSGLIGLAAAVDAADRDDAVRAIIFTGEGTSFCNGIDISAGNTFQTDPAPGEIRRGPGGLLSLRIFECTKPVIGAVNGTAVGIGATMLLRLYPPWHRARSLFDMVPAPSRRNFSLIEMDLCRQSGSCCRGSGGGSGAGVDGKRRSLRPCRRTGARHRGFDFGSLGRADPANDVEDAWRRPPDVGAGDDGYGAGVRFRRRRGIVPRKAPAEFPDAGQPRHAGLLSLVAEPGV